MNHDTPDMMSPEELERFGNKLAREAKDAGVTTAQTFAPIAFVQQLADYGWLIGRRIVSIYKTLKAHEKRLDALEKGSR
jgi:hypothetical protein